MAKSRIGHIVEAQILQAIGVDYIDECVPCTIEERNDYSWRTHADVVLAQLRSEVLTPADPALHVDKHVSTNGNSCQTGRQANILSAALPS